MNKNLDIVELQELCYSITDCHHSTPLYTETGKIVIRNFNIKNGRLSLDDVSYTDESHFEQRIAREKPEAGDLIITREAPMGEVCIIPENLECCLGQRMVLIKPHPKKVSNQFLLYSLLSNYCQTQIKKSEGTGSIVSNLRIPVLKELHIPNLPLNDQKKIAKVLSDLDAKIELNTRINAELEAMAKLVYEYWFVQFDFPNKDGKPYKSSGGKMVWNEELKREVPEGWRSGTTAEIFEFNPTLSIPKGSLAKYLDMNSIPQKGFMTLEPEVKEFNGGVKFQNGDVVVARITPCLENGKTGLITQLEGNEVGFGSTEFIVIRGKEMELSGFASFLARSDSFRNFAIGNMTGTSGRKRVDAKTLKDYILPIPGSETLKEFESYTSPIFQKQTINIKQNQQLSSLRDWLLPMLINGQVTVAETEERVEEELGMVAEKERSKYSLK